MSKFNGPGRSVRGGLGPIKSATTADGHTAEGAPGYSRNWQGELFLLAVTNMVGEHAFYESATDRDTRYRDLIRHGAVTDPEWTRDMLVWLRTGANLRSAAIVGAVEFAHARREKGLPGYSREVVSGVLQRAEEPVEALAYWNSRFGQRGQPMSFKKGVGDAVRRLWTERAVLKWDSATRALRFANVQEVCHPRPADEHQAALFGYVLDRRRKGGDIPHELRMIRENAAFLSMPVDRRRAFLSSPGAADSLSRAGITWEALAGWLQGPMDASAWEAVIPSMGYMALLRNLRNFDAAEVSDKVAAAIADRIADPDEVARSRQMPMRFLSAYNAAPSLRWSWPLEQALQHSLSNLPKLGGRTLIMIDTSASMSDSFSKDGSLRRWDAATMFGLALAQRCATAKVVSFSTRSTVFTPNPGESLLAQLSRFRRDYFLNSGTDTASALQEHYAQHDRVVVLTDEQAAWSGRTVAESVPSVVPMHTFNLAGYQYGHAPTGPNRYAYGGLTDACFRLIPLVESGRNGEWPWESAD